MSPLPPPEPTPSPASSTPQSGCFNIQRQVSLPRLDPLKVVTFYPCMSVEDFHNPKQSYPPLFSHHFFTDDEVIWGYDELTISFYYIPFTFDVYLSVEGRYSPFLQDTAAALLSLNEALNIRTPFPGGYVFSSEEFEVLLRRRLSEGFIPPGRVIYEEILANGAILQVRECDFIDEDEQSLDEERGGGGERGRPTGCGNDEKSEFGGGGVVCNQSKSARTQVQLEGYAQTNTQVNFDKQANAHMQANSRMQTGSHTQANSHMQTGSHTQANSHMQTGSHTQANSHPLPSAHTPPPDGVASLEHTDKLASPLVKQFEDALHLKAAPYAAIATSSTLLEKGIDFSLEDEEVENSNRLTYYKEAGNDEKSSNFDKSDGFGKEKDEKGRLCVSIADDAEDSDGVGGTTISSAVFTGECKSVASKVKREGGSDVCETRTKNASARSRSNLRSRGKRRSCTQSKTSEVHQSVSEEVYPVCVLQEKKIEKTESLAEEHVKEDGIHIVGGLEDQRIWRDDFEDGWSKRALIGISLSTPAGFRLLHRRMEWFLHWFIESASSIECDDRWRVILTYIVTDSQQESASMKLKRGEVHNHTHSILPLPALNTPDSTKKRVSGSQNQQSDASNQSKMISLTSPPINKKYRAAQLIPQTHKESSPGVLESFNVGASRCGVGGLIKQSSSGGGVRAPLPSSSNHWRGASYHLAAFATTYTFCSITYNRRRISQFMVFPHMQQQGLGILQLEQIYKNAIEDSRVCEVTVEDPASSFSQLRDIVSLKLYVDMGPFSTDILYPDSCTSQKCSNADSKTTAKKALSEKKTKDLAHVLPGRQSIIEATKETLVQATRIYETLQLCKVLPHPLPSPPSALYTTPSEEDAQAINSRRDWRAVNPQKYAVSGGLDVNEEEESFSNSEVLKEVRVSIKKRLRRDHLDDFADLPGVGLSSVGNNTYREMVKLKLDRMWNELYFSYYRTIRKLRQLYPLPTS